MPRGAEYDPKNSAPQSDNPIETGQTQAHGTGSTSEDVNRAHKTAEMPAADAQNEPGLHSGGGSSGATQGGSGKGGHEPKSLGENKGLGAHKS